MNKLLNIMKKYALQKIRFVLELKNKINQLLVLNADTNSVSSELLNMKPLVKEIFKIQIQVKLTPKCQVTIKNSKKTSNLLSKLIHQLLIKLVKTICCLRTNQLFKLGSQRCLVQKLWSVGYVDVNLAVSHWKFTLRVALKSGMFKKLKSQKTKGDQYQIHQNFIHKYNICKIYLLIWFSSITMLHLRSSI